MSVLSPASIWEKTRKLLSPAVGWQTFHLSNIIVCWSNRREEQKKTWISWYLNMSVSVEGVCVCRVPVGVQRQPVQRGWNPVRRPWRIEKRRRCVGSSRSQKTWGWWTWPARAPLATGKKDYQPAERGHESVRAASVLTTHLLSSCTSLFEECMGEGLACCRLTSPATSYRTHTVVSSGADHGHIHPFD